MAITLERAKSMTPINPNMSYIETIEKTLMLAEKIAARGDASRGNDLVKNLAMLRMAGKLGAEQLRAVEAMARVIRADDSASEVTRKLRIIMADAVDELPDRA